ncbi:thioredoxin [Paenibacillus sp. J31TS4]|uniref:thioredoxin family protein n=1 Tax=Paenibacillus sp. J31TS4 TaxID=2807195 RepID=UPI001B0F7450|nr:thioredoxin family protein [Paenibacillus sp. J31TS4]GIP39016.1 thioredoxin [Paenibacillus sp. J31TS4]
MKAGHVTDQTVQAAIGQEGLVLVEFWAPWCPLCKQLDPILDQLAEENEHRLKIVKLNVETDSVLSTELIVMSLPAMFFYRNGEIVGTVTGFVPKPTLQSAIDQLS